MAQKGFTYEKVILPRSNESWQKDESWNYEHLTFITKKILPGFLVGSKVSLVIISNLFQMLKTFSDP
jgi:hypothetical protein